MTLSQVVIFKYTYIKKSDLFSKIYLMYRTFVENWWSEVLNACYLKLL